MAKNFSSATVSLFASASFLVLAFSALFCKKALMPSRVYSEVRKLEVDAMLPC